MLASIFEDEGLFDKRPCESGCRSANAKYFAGKALIIRRLAGREASEQSIPEQGVYRRCDQVGPERSGTSSAVKMPSGSAESTSVVLRSSREAIAAERNVRCCSYTSISLQYSMTMYRDGRLWSRRKELPR
jgi:hypothetical protein